MTAIVEVDGREVALSRLDKVFWPATGFTKGQMLDYYRAVAPALLPHLAGRPLTLARFPDGVDGPGWYQSNCRGSPPWLPVAELTGRAGQRLRYCLVNDLAALLWVANLGTIELHPFLADAARPDRPHALVFDLDPGPPAGVIECAVVALDLRDALAARGLAACAKTSGAKGLHLYVPLDGTATYAETKPFARAWAREAVARRPELVVDVMARAARGGRVFIDWGQNDPSKSTIAPYSLRATPRPGVSTPVGWDEVEVAARGLPERLAFSPEDVLARVARDGDRFAPVLELRQPLR